MKSKKFLIIVIALVVALLGVMTTLVVVLVNMNQGASSKIHIKYTSVDVSVRLSAKAYLGNNTIILKNGTSTYVDLTPSNPYGGLDQEQDELNLDYDNNKIIFEYKFQNLSDIIDAKIDLDSSDLNIENVNIKYAYSLYNPISVTDLDETNTQSEYESQLLPAFEEETKNIIYVYVIAQVGDLLSDASLEGNFVWNLSRVTASAVTTYDSSGNIIDESKYFEGTKIYEPEWTAIANKRFNGYVTDLEELTEASFPITLSGNVNLYPQYQEANLLDTSYYTYDSSLGGYVMKTTVSGFTDTECIIPDTFNGSNGVFPVVKIESIPQDENVDWTLEQSVFSNCGSIEELYIGNYVTEIEDLFYYYNMVGLTPTTCTFIDFGRSLEVLGENGHGFVLQGLTNLESIKIYTNIESCSGFEGTALYNSETGVSDFGFVAIPFANDSERYVMINDKDINIDVGAGINVYFLYYGVNWEKLAFVPSSEMKDSSQVITSSTFPSAMTTIPGGINLSDDFEIPNTVTKLGYGAFKGSSRTSIAIPDSVTKISAYALSNCANLTNITIGKNVTDIDVTAFSGGASKTIVFAEGRTTIEDYLMDGCTNIAYLSFPSSVTSIGNYAFRNCTNLLSVTIPSTIKTMGNYAFYNNSALTTLSISEGVKEIGMHCFEKCTSLLSIVIPDSLTTLGFNAFQNCSAVTSLTIGKGLTTIEGYTFNGLTKVKSIIVPTNIQKIKQKAFNQCFYLYSTNGGTGLVFEDQTNWARYSDSNYSTLIESNVDMSDAELNARRFADNTGTTGTGYNNYYWQRVNTTT